jgi:hypothetical protein
MPYAVENALYQWQEGERRIRDAPDLERADLERAAEIVLDELRRRLGSRFLLDELAVYYSEGTDWAEELATRYAAGSDAASVVDSAFARYAREASNFAGGRPHERHGRP